MVALRAGLWALLMAGCWDAYWVFSMVEPRAVSKVALWAVLWAVSKAVSKAVL